MSYSKAVLFVMVVATVLFAVPPYLNYQAKLTDIGGAPLSGVHDITFRIYDVETGPSSPLWSEIHYGVDVVDGFFAVRLGDAGSPLNLPFDGQYWLEIAVGTDVLTPREPLSTNAYSFMAGNAELINGNDISDVFRITDSLYNILGNTGIQEDSLYIWGEYLTLFHGYLLDQGWDVDTFESFAELADSLRKMDFDSLINAYADSISEEFINMISFSYIDYGVAIFFDGDTLAKAWVDTDSMKLMMVFNADTSSMGFVECENGIAYLIEEDTLAWLVYEDYRFLIHTESDTLFDLQGLDIPNGRALLMNDDTLITATVEIEGDTISLVVNCEKWGSIALLDDEDGFGISYDIGGSVDTLMYLNYDSLLTKVLGFSDIDSVLQYYADSLSDEYTTFVNVDSLLEWHLDSVVSEYSIGYQTMMGTIPLWQAGAPYVMNNIAGQDLFNCESGLIPTMYSIDGEVQVKLVVRVSANTAGSSNFQIRAHDGTTEVYPITFGDMTWNAVQTGWVVESDWKDFSAAVNPWEIHLYGWVDSGSTDFTSAYLMVRSK